MFSSAPLLLLLLSHLAARGSASGSPAVAEAFGAVLTVVSPGQDYLSGDSLRFLFNTLEKRVQCAEVSCEKCNLTEGVQQLVGNHSKHEEEERRRRWRHTDEELSVGVSDFPAVAAGCVLYLTSPALVCAAVAEGRWGEETESFLHNVTREEHHGESHEESEEDEPGHEHEHIEAHGLEALLRELEHHYKPVHTESCVSPTDITAEGFASRAGQGQEAGAVMGSILFYALQGRCFTTQSLPEEGFFLDYIMERLGSQNSTLSGLETLMGILKLGPDTDHDHEHGEEHGDEHEEEHADEHADHDHSGGGRWKRSNHGHPEGHETNDTWAQRCFSAEELILIHGLASNSSASSGMNSSALARLSPALVQQILSGACAHVTEPVHPDNLSEANRYIYATVANTIITLMSMLGIGLLLCTSCSSAFQLCIQFCISLAVGSLTGDALLHLTPMFLGLHSHSADSGDHNHEEEGGESLDYLYKMLVVIGGIYFFYLMETIFFLVTQKNGHQNHLHQHGDESEPHHCDHGRVLQMYQEKKREKAESQSASKTDLVSFDDSENAASAPQVRTREQRLLPYMITIGDGIHNFADGLAIGAAFSLSWKSGLATSVAVFCHELPHELGDFAILLHCGLSVRRAILLNVGSAMTSYIGLYIALSLATDIATTQWIGAITAGLFLYVGLADMLPTLIHIRFSRPWLMFLLQNVGLLTGWGILLLLSLYEDQITFF
ncbi:zinc transporter ZIP4 [Genypterus blacodes]|uniref:zinc transporter ZIP4 n=1 Tax=Genypterus blacodes TaxID=154954 RepID=UPI003F777F2F